MPRPSSHPKGLLGALSDGTIPSKRSLDRGLVALPGTADSHACWSFNQSVHTREVSEDSLGTRKDAVIECGHLALAKHLHRSPSKGDGLGWITTSKDHSSHQGTHLINSFWITLAIGILDFLCPLLKATRSYHIILLEVTGSHCCFTRFNVFSDALLQ